MDGVRTIGCEGAVAGVSDSPASVISSGDPIPVCLEIRSGGCMCMRLSYSLVETEMDVP